MEKTDESTKNQRGNVPRCLEFLVVKRLSLLILQDFLGGKLVEFRDTPIPFLGGKFRKLSQKCHTFFDV